MINERVKEIFNYIDSNIKSKNIVISKREVLNNIYIYFLSDTSEVKLIPFMAIDGNTLICEYILGGINRLYTSENIRLCIPHIKETLETLSSEFGIPIIMGRQVNKNEKSEVKEEIYKPKFSEGDIIVRNNSCKDIFLKDQTYSVVKVDKDLNKYFLRDTDNLYSYNPYVVDCKEVDSTFILLKI